MSHYIGTGTVNLSINVPKDVRSVLGRAAFLAGKSLGEFLKEVIPAGLDAVNPAAASRVREIQRAYYGAAMVLVFLGALVCGERMEARRCRTRIDEVREQAA